VEDTEHARQAACFLCLSATPSAAGFCRGVASPDLPAVEMTSIPLAKAAVMKCSKCTLFKVSQRGAPIA